MASGDANQKVIVELCEDIQNLTIIVRKNGRRGEDGGEPPEDESLILSPRLSHP